MGIQYSPMKKFNQMQFQLVATIACNNKIILPYIIMRIYFKKMIYFNVNSYLYIYNMKDENMLTLQLILDLVYYSTFHRINK